MGSVAVWLVRETRSERALQIDADGGVVVARVARLVVRIADCLVGVANRAPKP